MPNATRWQRALPFKRSGDQSGVMPAEPKGVIQHDPYFPLACDVRRVIEVAFFAWIFQINRWRNDGISNSKRTRSHLDSTRASQQMAGHRLGRTDGHFIGVLAKNLLDRARLALAIRRRRSHMVRISREAVSCDFTIDFRAARFGVL